MTERYELVCFDMAGTTLLDGGLVLEAFRRTIAALDVAGADAARMEAYVVQTMGQSKIEVFTALFDARGPLANERFEREFLAVVADVGVSEVPGAHDAVRALRSVSRVALTTGFAAYATVAALTAGSVELAPILISEFLDGNNFGTYAHVGYAIGVGMLVILAVTMVGYVLVQRRASRWLRT
jgi:phosphoglycolate phosphatase